ncbi:hypothetical protein ACA097_09550 [Pseudomonas sp. QL9]|uniref:phage head completion protein n=1 Tax=Pseudomonas sp. QL9 TaxID=3242725 RepID=UPI00352AF348
MRAGNLRHRATVLALSDSLQPVEITRRWVGIRSKESGDAPAAAGLRASVRVEVRARFSSDLVAGRYLRHGARLLYINDARDFTGERAELLLSCEELVGLPATMTATPAAEPAACRVFLAHGVKRPAENVGLSAYSTQLEAALIEVGRPQVGAEFLVGGVTWRVTGLVDDDDDRIVRRMWVKKA